MMNLKVRLMCDRLKDKTIWLSNQVWAANITYFKLEHGYVYKGFASSLHCLQGGLDEWAQFAIYLQATTFGGGN